ncbi:MAG: transcriptional regulator [bacterium]|nr:transcriptional regulator [bacterium]
MDPNSDFLLADWLVQPSLNRLSRGEQTVQVEPKLMDVLAFLASRAGDVVSKDQITDAVWTDQFITDSVVTRAIATLRRALEDDAHDPSYIETISKRGYRLIVAATPAADAEPSPLDTPQPWKAAGSAVPFVVSQWVRGDRFYGRAAQISEILDGNRNWLWLLGTRRVGKTSLLKQLEHLTASSPESGYFPIFWDLQGAASPDELHRDFSDALLDTEERLDRLGIEVDEVAADDLFISLGRLRRKLRSKRLKLLLLCDEVEELIQLNRKDPALLRKLRRAMQSREDIRSVLASSIRLWALAGHQEDTSPFLHGFTPPVYLDILRDDEARSLIRQAQLDADVRPSFDDAAVERIRERCGNHPYLIQLLCQRYLELGDLDEAFEQVTTDSMVSFFFSVDFDLLTGTERRIITTIAEHTAASSKTIQLDFPLDSPSLVGSLNRLENLGFIRRNEERRFYLVNYFFRRWLQNLPLTRPLSGGG